MYFVVRENNSVLRYNVGKEYYFPPLKTELCSLTTKCLLHISQGSLSGVDLKWKFVKLSH